MLVHQKNITSCILFVTLSIKTKGQKDQEPTGDTTFLIWIRYLFYRILTGIEKGFSNSACIYLAALHRWSCGVKALLWTIS